MQPEVQELVILPGHMSSHPIFNGVCVPQSLVFRVVSYRSLLVLLSFFLLVMLYFLSIFDLHFLITLLVFSHNKTSFFAIITFVTRCYYYRIVMKVFQYSWLLFYYCLLLRELFSYSVVLCGRVLESTTRSLYLTRQNYRKTVLEGEDNNIFRT